MSLLATDVPYGVYADLQGAPLDSGYLYFGVENQNPKTAPLTVYWDAAGTQPVAQPVRTRNGFPLRAGAIATIYSPTAYSVMVCDSAGQLVYYAPSAQAFSLWASLAAEGGSSLVNFIAAGTGAVIRSLQSKSRDIVNVADYDVAGDGSDETIAFQNAMNAGRKVIIPASMRITCAAALIPSTTHLLFEKGAGVRTLSGANCPAMQNANWNKTGWGGSTYGLDSDITIEGLYVDGNQASQSHNGSGVYANEPTTGIRLFGVTNLTLKDITVHQARTYGIWVCSIYNLTAHDIRFDQLMTGTPDNQDGLHINGPATNLDIRNVRGSTNDDMIALNADDGAQGSNVTAGAITNVVIDGVYPVACLNGVRLLSATSRIDQVTVRSVKGSTRDVAVNLSPYGLGAGNTGSLTIEDIDVRCSNNYQPTTSNYYSIITLDGVADVVTVRNVKNLRPADNRPAVLVPGTANIGLLTIDGVSILEAAGSTLSGIKPVSVLGLIDTLSISNVWLFRDSTLTQTGNVLSIVAPGKGVNNLICNNWIVERTVNPIYLGDGLLSNVTLNGIRDTNGLPGYALLNLSSASGATTNVSSFNCATDYGRQLLTKSGASLLGSRTTVDNAGASGASATLSGNQALTASTYNKLLFNTLVYDRVTGEYSTANENFTVSQGPGLYAISVMVDLTIPTNPTDVTVALYKGGTLYRVIPGTGRCFGNTDVGGTVFVIVAQGDVFDIRVFVSNAATANNTASTVVSYERLK